LLPTKIFKWQQSDLKRQKDLASAILAKGKAEAEVIMFNNEAEAAGWKAAVAAFSGDGNEYARWTLFKKIAPAYRAMMVNTADGPIKGESSPLVSIFKEFSESSAQGIPAVQPEN